MKDENIKNCFCKKKVALTEVGQDADVIPCVVHQSDDNQVSKLASDEVASNTPDIVEAVSSVGGTVGSFSAPNTGYESAGIAGVVVAVFIVLIALTALTGKLSKSLKSKIMAIALLFSVGVSGLMAPKVSAAAEDLECDGYEVTVKHYYRDFYTGEVLDLGVVDTFGGTGVARYDYAVASMQRLVGGDFGDRLGEVPSDNAERFREMTKNSRYGEYSRGHTIDALKGHSGSVEIVSPDWSVNCDGVYEIYYTFYVVHEVEIEDE